MLPDQWACKEHIFIGNRMRPSKIRELPHVLSEVAENFRVAQKGPTKLISTNQLSSLTNVLKTVDDTDHSLISFFTS